MLPIDVKIINVNKNIFFISLIILFIFHSQN